MTTVAFVVNGEPDSAMGHRAAAFAERLRDLYDLRVFHRTGRKASALARFFAALMRFRPQVCYVFDMAYSGVGAAATADWASRHPPTTNASATSALRCNTARPPGVRWYGGSAAGWLIQR